MTNFEKIMLISIGVLVVVVLVVGVIIFRQQKAITALSGSATGTSNQAAAQSSVQKKSPSLAEVIKQFSGTVESISGNQLTVSVTLPDFSKPKDPDKFGNTDKPMNISANDFETFDKKITVNTNEKTIFASKKLADLKSGDTISVISDKSPYSADTVTAEKITSELPK